MTRSRLAPAVAGAPSPSARVERALPGRQPLRDEVRAALLRARAVERTTPERYGFDMRSAERIFTSTGLLCRHYFRTEVHGIERLPHGRVLLVANHGSHALSWDGANIITACLLEAEPPRLVHAMAEHRLMSLPILGYAARRIGAVDGRRATCIRLLRENAAVLTFPEGTRAHARRFRDRYRLAPFGHGFVRVALLTQTPIVPVAAIGSEEEAPLIANPAWLRRLVRTPVAPLTPTVVVPLPVRYRLYFGEPIRLAGSLTAPNVAGGVRAVREALAGLIEGGLAARRHVFW